MTIQYSLTRSEIVRVFLLSLGRSPRLLVIVIAISAWPALIWLSITGAYLNGIRLPNLLAGVAWMAGGFLSFTLLLFLRGKTSERTLTISREGIATTIGRMRGSVSWSKIKEVKETDRYVLLISRIGNAFFIPSRAFDSVDQRQDFLSSISIWRASE